MSRKLYLAGSISRRAELQRVAGILREQGYEVTSRWLDEVVPAISFDKYSADLKARRAVRDLEDVQRADVVIHFANGYGKQARGGGRHWEGGYAWAFGKPIIVLGEPDHLFHFLPGVDVADDLEDALEILAWYERTLFAPGQSGANLETMYDEKGTN